MQTITSEFAGYASELRERGTDFRLGIVKSTENLDRKHNPGLFGPHAVISSLDSQAIDKLGENLNQLRRKSHVGEQEKGVETLVDAALLPANSGLFRPNITKILIAVTDAEDHTLKPEHATSLIGQLNGRFQKAQWLALGLGSPREQKCPEAESAVTELLQTLVEASGGKMGRICGAAIKNFLVSATETVFLPLLEFPLEKRLPSGSRIIPSSIRVFVNEREISAGGFRWKESNKAIEFSASTMPALGDNIKVNLTYAR
jgi:hypothetical protein